MLVIGLLAAVPSRPATGRRLQNAGAPFEQPLMPVAAEMHLSPGMLPVPARPSVALPATSDRRLRAAVQRALDRLAIQTGGAVSGALVPGPEAFLRVEVAHASAAVPRLGEDESYRLTVQDDVVLQAPTTLGALRGLQTLLQWVRLGPDGYELPRVQIRDRPRFPWRGLLIDVCRHWIGPEVLKRNLDAMEAVKLNVLHWHLTEDQAFRIETRRYPRLHEQGSGGHYYTQQQVREIVAYAADRGIRVMPEFDVPGHTTAWFAGHPELATLPGPYEPETQYGIMDPAMDPSKEAVYELLAGFFGEMAELFPDEYMHIGGDEVNGKHWDASTRIQAFKAEHGLADNHDLQAWFNRRVEQILQDNGKRMVGWTEIAHPDIPHTAVVQSWRGHESLFANVRAGYSGILSWGYYLDLMHTAAEHYAVDPLGHAQADTLSEQQRARVLGGEACMWSELVNEETIDSRIWPRAAAIAERLWSPESVQDVDDMMRRLEQTSRWLEWIGLTHRSSYRLMLQLIVGSGPVRPLRVLADTLVPPRDYERHAEGVYDTSTPLNRLVDAVRPESRTAYLVSRWVDAWLHRHDERARASLQRLFRAWVGQYRQLRPTLSESALLAGVEPVSRDLSALGARGLAALDEGAGAGSEDGGTLAELLARSRRPRASLRIAVADAVGRLVSAAERSAQPGR